MIALRQLADGGVEAISLKAIALELGLTGPAIYRYFASRNELLTELIIDAYDDLEASLEAAVKATTIRSGRAQLHALADAYRVGAGGAAPLPPPVLGPGPRLRRNAPRLVDAADRSMATLLDLYPRTGSRAAGDRLIWPPELPEDAGERLLRGWFR